MRSVLAEIRDSAFDPEVELARFRASVPSGVGAVVSMTGLVRGRGADGGSVEGLILHHYPGFTQLHIERLMERAERREGVLATGVVHRVGVMGPCEAIVLVSVGACHRREAFEAAEYLMDGLKTSAPFWKQEVRDGGRFWIEPRSRDYADALRWSVEG